MFSTPLSEAIAEAESLVAAAPFIESEDDLLEGLQPLRHGGDGHEHRAGEDEREDHHEPRRLCRLGAPDGECHECEDPAEGEAESGDDGDAAECSGHPAEEAEPDGVAEGRTDSASQQSKHFQRGSATVLCTTVNYKA